MKNLNIKFETLRELENFVKFIAQNHPHLKVRYSNREVGRPAKSLNQAEVFLKDLLKSGKQKVDLIIFKSRKYGITKGTLRRAKFSLKIFSYKIGEERYWSLDHA